MALKKSRVNINVSEQDRTQIIEAAAKQGLTITDFIIKQCLYPADQDNSAALEALNKEITEMKAQIFDQQMTINKQIQELKEGKLLLESSRQDMAQWAYRYDNLQITHQALEHAYMLKTVSFWHRLFKQLPNK